MAKRQTNLPIFLYVKINKSSKNISYEGDLCDGRKPTKTEKLRLRNCFDIINPDGDHFIAGIKNPQHKAGLIPKFTNSMNPYTFPTIDSLIEQATIFYNNEGYTSGLILSFDGKKPSNDKVLILGHEYNSEINEFLLEAQRNNRWANFLNIDSNL